MQVVLLWPAMTPEDLKASLSRSPALHVRGKVVVPWIRHLATVYGLTVDEANLAGAVTDLTAAFRPLVEDPLEFLRETRVLPLESEEGVRIDVVFGLLPFEREAIARAVPIVVAGTPVRFCTAEDLILMKIISTREQDLADAEEVTVRRINLLDLGYLEPRIR